MRTVFRLTTLLLLTTQLAGLAPSARAARPEGDLGVGLHATAYEYVEGSGGIKPAVGAHARLRLSRSFAVEGAVDVHEEEFEGGRVKATNYPVTASLLWYLLSISRVSIYGALGPTWNNTDFRGETDDPGFRRRLGYHLGAGVDLQLGPRAVLSLDLRRHISDVSLDVANTELELTTDSTAGSVRLTYYP